MSITEEAVTNPSVQVYSLSAQISKIGEITKSQMPIPINNLLACLWEGKLLACTCIVPLDEVISYSEQSTYTEMMTLLCLL